MSEIEQDIPDLTSDDFEAAVAAFEGAPKQEFKPAREPARFEGKPVDRMEIKISGVKELGDAYNQLQVGLHDRVRLVVETRVNKVNHYISKDNELVRCQEVVATAVDIVPWNPADPSDDGVLRA